MNSTNPKSWYKWYVWAIVEIGSVICVHAAFSLPIGQIGFPFLFFALTTVIIASRIVVRFFRFDSSISVSDIFIFLALLVYGGEAAILIGTAESFCSSLRITSKRLTMTFNASAMACSTF